MIRSIQIRTLWCFLSQQNMHINKFNFFSLVVSHAISIVSIIYFARPWNVLHLGVGYLKKSQGLKHTIRNPMCVSVYIIFLSGALLNFNNVIIKKDFHNFLNIMIAHYIKKSLAKESTFLDFILCDIKIYLFKNNICKIIL